MKRVVAVLLSLALAVCLCGCEPEKEKLTDHAEDVTTVYVLNRSTKTFHLPDCRHVSKIKSSNKEVTYESRSELYARGYKPCKTCKP